MDHLTRALLDARDGDRLAWGTVVRTSQADVWRLCAVLGSRADADDLAQETYVRAVRALPSFRGDASGRTWLLAIARRVCADAVRARVRQRRRDRSAPEPRAFVEDSAGVLALEALLAGLDDDQRAAFVLTQMHGCSYAEAAEVCGVPVGTIRSRVARARESLVAAVRAAEAR